ncbi:MAG: hypothetical protein LBT47_12215 [Deltaproteobacteria bacterium]|nr:hypothetical protein [Deltaproteobacteria bacterium]
MISLVLKNKQASVSLELALITGFVISILWFSAEVAQYYRFENIFHSSTATLADILANQKINEEKPIKENLDLVAQNNTALLLFTDMLQGMPGQFRYNEIFPGLKVTYYDTNAIDPDTDKQYPPESWSSGDIACPLKGEPQKLEEIGERLKTANNVAKLRLVMVEACVQTVPRKLGSLFFPDRYDSFFVSFIK